MPPPHMDKQQWAPNLLSACDIIDMTSVNWAALGTKLIRPLSMVSMLHIKDRESLASGNLVAMGTQYTMLMVFMLQLRGGKALASGDERNWPPSRC